MSLPALFLRRIFRDLGLKLAAIFLATALYLHVHRESERTEIFRVPLDWICAVADPAHGGLPDSASVQIRALPRQMERLRHTPLRVQADLCVAEAGSLVLRQFTGSDVVLPEGVLALEVVILEPAGVYARANGGVGTPK